MYIVLIASMLHTLGMKKVGHTLMQSQGFETCQLQKLSLNKGLQTENCKPIPLL